MKNAKIVLVAEWDGWCGACAAERPLVLTRAGRQRLRTWLTGADDHSRPLVLTCRLCGTGVDVPPEHDDPPVTVTEDAAAPALPGPGADVTVEHVEAAVEPAPVQVSASTDELRAGRQAVARALGGLLQQRAAAPTAAPAGPAEAPVVAGTPVVAAALPLQRTAASSGLTELQLLADGIDLLSTGRG